MQTSFNSAASSTERAEQFLKQENYNYQKRPDGTLLVQGNIDIARRGYHELPDLSCVIVTGNFCCQDNHLTSLKGAPREVQGGFWCNNNEIESLEYAPKGVTGQYICSDNRLTSLAHAPEALGGDFSCIRNPLTSLEGAPKTFAKLFSNFGIFLSWNEVPEAARTSPQTKTVMAQDAVTLRGDIRVSKPIAFRKP